jgi:hypothetical protein
MRIANATSGRPGCPDPGWLAAPAVRRIMDDFARALEHDCRSRMFRGGLECARPARRAGRRESGPFPAAVPPVLPLLIKVFFCCRTRGGRAAGLDRTISARRGESRVTCWSDITSLASMGCTHVSATKSLAENNKKPLAR